MSGLVAQPLRSVPRRAVRAQFFDDGTRQVPEEVPVAFSFLGSTHAVMMASPADIEDFAYGFCLSEGIIADASQLESLDVVAVDGGIDVQIRLQTAVQDALKSRRRAMAGPVGCGLCGVESIEAALQPVQRVASGAQFSGSDIVAAMAALGGHQPINQATRAVHAAGFFMPGAGMVAVREDVGRHNALDKLIGALLRRGTSGADGFIVLSSRVSLEMVQKTARLGAPLLAAISAPTALALDVAENAGICVVAIARDDAFEIFTHRDCIVMMEASHVG